jgi:pilus assembly protein Flp/PilA
VKNFAFDNCGATSIEYAMIGSLISIAIVTALSTIGPKLAGYLTAVSAHL